MLPAPSLASPTRVDYGYWETVKDVVDELIDLSLNHRQSGHPGGSRSKVHALVALMLSGSMRWDLRQPWRPLQDRFVLSAGHTVPVVYASLAVLNEAFAIRHERTGDARFELPDDGRWALRPRHLLDLRRNGGLPGHAEMVERSLFLKYNTGPSGHGMPPAAGQALALRMSGHGDVRVFCMEGEGGLTTGAAHETKNSAWGLGLDNLVFLVDWNDFGIDARPASSVVAGHPRDWFAPYGWRVLGTDAGMEWQPVTDVLREAVHDDGSGAPTAVWFRTVKGRTYGKVDAASHGTAWPRNSEGFWTGREHFMRRYGVGYEGFGAPAPPHPDDQRRQAASHMDAAISVLRESDVLVEYLTDRLLELAAEVPEPAPTKSSTAIVGRLLDADQYPPTLTRAPGTVVSNRVALSDWGAFVNSRALAEAGRPVFVVCSADLAESTGIAGFGNGTDGAPGAGWYERSSNPAGVVLPQEITEFTNAGLMAGLATVNLSPDPRLAFDGWWGACSTYGAFSYLTYGPLRLFSQLAQDSPTQVGKVLYVAGHSGFETAEDSRTHFGIYEPGIMELFPAGHVINLHPWEYNEVPWMLAAALATEVPIVVLHLTRPAVAIPDRTQLRIDPAREAARGAYLLRAPADEVGSGTVVVRGTHPAATVVDLLPELDRLGLDLKIVMATSWELFARQDSSWRERILTPLDRRRAMVVSNASLRFMSPWHDNPDIEHVSLVPDWDDRWRTGGALEEVAAEAHLDAEHVLAGLVRLRRDT